MSVDGGCFMPSPITAAVDRDAPLPRWDQRVPPPYAAGAFGDIADADPADGWTLFWQARARMAIDEFDAVPMFEKAYAAFVAAGDAVACGLTARTAVVAIYNSAATFAGLDTWLSRTDWGVPPPADLHDPSARAWWLAGELARVYAHAATEYTSPATLAIRDALLDLVSAPLDADANLIAACALLELAEFEDDGRIFDLLCAGVSPLLEGGVGSPLFRGRSWHRIGRCAQSVGAYRGRGAPLIDPNLAEARALELAEQHGLAHLCSNVLVARCLYAHVRGDEATADRALLDLGRATDFRRPLEAAWYYYLRGQAAARHEDVTQALLYFGQAVESADSAALPISAQQNFVIGHATALAHTGRWQEAAERFDRLISEQSGRDRDITECRRAIVDFHRACAETPERAPAMRHDILALARDARWRLVGLLTPRSTARFLADALRDGQFQEFVTQVVAQRRLPAEPDFPRNWPWQIRIESLGGFRIEVDGAAVSFGARPQRKPLELLMLLAALGPQPVPTPVLIDALWPAADGDKARNSLDMAVLRLRRILGHEEALRVEGGCLLLDRARVWVDAWAFQEDEASPYAGTFLDGEAGHDAVAAQRERLEVLLVDRTRRHGAALEAAGRPADALSLYEDALRHSALAEALHRGVIRCHLALGEPAAALLAFQRCEDRLAQRLGVRPAPATQDLVRALRGP
jgi:DNA-binding SARP family transcriptional activator/tetratricopeptide (TPR) repeat protein